MANPTRNRLIVSAALLSGIVIGGGLFFWLILDAKYSLFESIYFAVITVSTVGYGELPQMEHLPHARLAVIFLIITGVVAVALFQSSMTAVLVEGAIGKAFRSRRMERRIAALSGHTIVAGCGRTGRFVVEELAASGKPFVIVDLDETAIEKVGEDLGRELLYVIGNATDDHSLIAAGMERAAGLVTALSDDPDNVFVTISARSLNAKARIVAKAVTISSEAKLARAGANATVSPHRIGGLRLVTEILRPHTAEFLDSMMRGTGEEQLRFDEVEVKSGRYVNRTLREAPIRDEANVLVVAIRRPDHTFLYNPPADQKLSPGSHIVVLGTRAGVLKLRDMLSGS